MTVAWVAVLYMALAAAVAARLAAIVPLKAAQAARGAHSREVAARPLPLAAAAGLETLATTNLGAVALVGLVLQTVKVLMAESAEMVDYLAVEPVAAAVRETQVHGRAALAA